MRMQKGIKVRKKRSFILQFLHNYLGHSLIEVETMYETTPKAKPYPKHL